MAIAVDTTTTSTIVTWSHTCTGSNLVLIVGVSTQDAGGAAAAVKYNGVAMTGIGHTAEGDSVAAMYYLINPDTGAHDIEVTIGSLNFNRGFAASYTGCKQSGQPDNSGTSHVTETNHSQALTPNLTNCWLVGMVRALVSSPSAGTGTTARATAVGQGIYDSNGIVPVGTSDSLNWTSVSNQVWLSILISLAATDSAPNSNFLIMF